MSQPIPDAHLVSGNQRKRIRMTDDEIKAYLGEHTGDIIISTILPDGAIHSVAMYYGLLGDKIGVLTKRKSQKVQNLRRDPRMTCLVATGQSYEELRGVELIGAAEVTDDPAIMRAILLSIRARRGQPVGEIGEGLLEAHLYNRVAIVHTATRIVSWDHRKLLELS